MRITNNTIVYGFLNSLNKALERQNTIQEKLADGKDIHRPSDNPIKTIRGLKFNTNLTINDQFTQNVKDALSWMKSTDSSLATVGNLMIRAKELAIRACAPNPDIAFKAAATEIDGLINNLVEVANTQIGDRYIFSGQMDKTKALVRTGDTFTYQGDANKISVRLQAGAVSPDQDSINLTALDVFGPQLELLNNLVGLKNELMSGSPDLSKISNEYIKLIDDNHNQVLQQQTHIGARMATYEMYESMLGDRDIIINGDISANEDLDIPRAIIDFKTSENVYRTALAVGARIMPASLVDFLR